MLIITLILDKFNGFGAVREHNLLLSFILQYIKYKIKKCLLWSWETPSWQQNSFHWATKYLIKTYLLSRRFNQVMNDSSMVKALSIFSSQQIEPLEKDTNGSADNESNNYIDSDTMSKSQKARKFLARSEDAISFVNTIIPDIKVILL